MTRRTALAAALGAGGLLLGLGLLSRDGSLLPSFDRTTLADARPAVLDTVTVRGRRVEVSMNGIVVQVGPGEDVWLSVEGDAFALRFEDEPRLDVEDHLLVVGRLRARGGRRWVDVSSWARLAADVRAPSGAGL